ncbi:MAG: hypothetical protein H6858_00535 [Rhodospirillales bacterium]|nr:hypothetical protein [Alphaproteobacteria bacterium]MCB1839397.1 hypothetical protein [Alphaproteobacteria bacterium]MCB9976066.1 hypothetical protein [Rhodospirillales bacterium]
MSVSAIHLSNILIPQAQKNVALPPSSGAASDPDHDGDVDGAGPDKDSRLVNIKA